jgi:DHA2 family multidrug resistance protein
VATTDMDYFAICLSLFFFGAGMPMYYVPITGLAMGSVDENEMASAAGLMNFVRTIAGAFATSLVTTFWQDGRYIAHDQLSGIVDPLRQADSVINAAAGSTGQMARELFDAMVTGQSMQLATNDLMMAIAVIFFISAFAIALAPKPTRMVDAASVGH